MMKIRFPRLENAVGLDGEKVVSLETQSRTNEDRITVLQQTLTNSNSN